MISKIIIEEANRLASLGLYEEAWRTLDTLPQILSKQLAALALRLRLCVELKKWGMGVEIAANFDRSSLKEHREAAGRFHLAHAVIACKAGDLDKAKLAVRLLSKIWPEGREIGLREECLADIW